MTIELSHGKARPTLPRSDDLAVPPPAADRPRQRDAQGRFAPGNTSGRGRGWRASIARMVGRDLQGEAAPLAREAWRVYTALLAELPHTGAQVSSLVASRARSAVLSARYAARAAELGLDTEEGQRALTLSMQLDQRAERLAVTALDISTRLAVAARTRTTNPIHAAILSAGQRPKEQM